jgi:hypothetical protein
VGSEYKGNGPSPCGHGVAALASCSLPTITSRHVFARQGEDRAIVALGGALRASGLVSLGIVAASHDFQPRLFGVGLGDLGSRARWRKRF